MSKEIQVWNKILTTAVARRKIDGDIQRCGLFVDLVL